MRGSPGPGIVWGMRLQTFCIAALRGLLVAGLIGAACLAILGGVFVLGDQQSHADSWDGLGAAIGIGLLLIAGALALVTGLALWLSYRNLPAALGLLGVAVLAILPILWAFLGGTGLLAAPAGFGPVSRGP